MTFEERVGEKLRELEARVEALESENEAERMYQREQMERR